MWLPMRLDSDANSGTLVCPFENPSSIEANQERSYLCMLAYNRLPSLHVVLNFDIELRVVLIYACLYPLNY